MLQNPKRYPYLTLESDKKGLKKHLIYAVNYTLGGGTDWLALIQGMEFLFPRTVRSCEREEKPWKLEVLLQLVISKAKRAAIAQTEKELKNT